MITIQIYIQNQLQDKILKDVQTDLLNHSHTRRLSVLGSDIVQRWRLNTAVSPIFRAGHLDLAARITWVKSPWGDQSGIDTLTQWDVARIFESVLSSAHTKQGMGRL